MTKKLTSCILLLVLMLCGISTAFAKMKAKDYERKIASIEKTMEKTKKQKEFLEFKQGLHEQCSCNCSSFHRSSASGYFDGKPCKVCHQHPKGAQHNSGVTQAITALQVKIEALEKRLAEMQDKIDELRIKAAEAEEWEHAACAFIPVAIGVAKGTEREIVLDTVTLPPYNPA